MDFVFCAVDMQKDETARLEEAYARAETPVVSNNSAHRATPDVPMMIPEVNPEHAAVIPSQRRRLGTRRGFVAVKPNCSLQSYVPALHPLMAFGPKRIPVVSTYQAISGAGKTFEDLARDGGQRDPVHQGGEEEKSEKEPLKYSGVASPTDSCPPPSRSSPPSASGSRPPTATWRRSLRASSASQGREEILGRPGGGFRASHRP